jgi:4,5-dihydroxyphthalate decarboxylase
MGEATVLRTVLADYPHTLPLKTGAVGSDSVRLEFRAVSPIHKAFAPMVREESADVSELAIVTALQAIAFGRPVVLLPVVVASRFQRGCLIAHADRPVAPAELPGRRVGVRAFTQTTGMWVRAHLVEDYGLASRDIKWVTRDGAHVVEYVDPPFVEHGIGENSLPDLLRSGGIDAAILGNDLPDGDEFVPVFPDAAARDREWWQQHGFMPINHMVVAGRTIAGQDPAAVRAAYELLRRADASVHRPDPDAPWPTVFGFAKLREPIEFVIDTCLEQGLLPRRLDVDEVFAPARNILGSAGD